MSKLERDLYHFIGRELYELSWICDYPINSNISLWCFFEGFKEFGFDVNINNKEKEAQFNSLRHTKNGDIKLFSTILSYEDILSGWKIHPKSSPHSIYDSICIVYDNFKDKFLKKDSNEETSLWFLLRNQETKEIRNSMENHLLPFFIEYHEHMLIPISGEIPLLKEPVIFDKVIEKFPMDVFRNSILYKPHFGPCAENLSEIDLNNDLDIDKYYPSENAMTDYFLGHYLNELSEEKGYPLYYKSKDKLRNLIIQREKAFMSGSLIKWRI